MRLRFAGLLPLLLTAAIPSAAQTRSLPVDCLPDQVRHWQAASPNPEARHGAGFLPGIVLGPPGDSGPTVGNTSVASLGPGGSMIYELVDLVIEDRPGPDFILFENAFFQGSVPTDPETGYAIFAEPVFVEVSTDGLNWVRFAHDPQALAEVSGNWGIDWDLHQRLKGLAGITPTFAGNWTVPNETAVWDPAGTGGISGAGGDAFDLAELGLSDVRFLRLTDAGSGNGYPGAAEGADLDALVVLHGRPVAPAGIDSDGDGLSDAEEIEIYSSLPGVEDTDGDGTSDGREVASCRDPLENSEDPFLPREPRLWVHPGECNQLRWSFLSTGALFDLLRGQLDQLAVTGPVIGLGATSCLVSQSDLWAYSCDGERPFSGEGFYYLVRESGAGYGRSSALLERETVTACP